MRLKDLQIIILLMLLPTITATGQSWDSAKGIGISSGVFKFIGDQTDKAAISHWHGLTLRYGLSPYVMLDFSALYGSFKPSVPGSQFKPDPDSPYHTFLFPFSLSIKATPVQQGRIKPYFTLGIGLLMWDLRDVTGMKDSVWDQHSFRWGRRVHGPLQKNPMLLEGLGIELYLSENIALDLQARFSTLLEISKDNVGLQDYNDQIVQGRATISYYFGYYKDTDKDGIQDKLDASPFHAEDFDGFQDEDGAPDFDNDGDGIPDLKDQAPDIPEDIDGYKDNDGIPDPDNDNDGITDINDQCPNEAEDVDGFNDGDGCPDLDNDGDGIMDANDDCPDEPETINSFEDSDGCPDKKPMAQFEKKGTKLILSGVNFATGSSALTETSYSILDKIVLQLREHMLVEVEIRGYTDSQGAAAANLALSERRAKAVMQYLINAGIAPSRMRAAGYGEQDPIAVNTTPQGRAQNRRIEFIRVN